MGERCTGTHFLEYAMKFNFNCSYVKGTKHFFQLNDEYNDDTCYIIIIRDVVAWIDSFFKRKHHVPDCNKYSIENFINNPFYSIYEEGLLLNTEIMEDRNIYTGERYKNIFELRNIKHKYLMNDLCKKTQNYIIINYEDLRDDYNNTLIKIQEKFNLERKNPNEFIKVPKYKGSYTQLYTKKEILLNNDIINFINKKNEYYVNKIINNM